MKISPPIKEFKKLTKANNLIVLSYKFRFNKLTPPAVYKTLAKALGGESFLLESIEGEEKICRFSFLGFSPICTFKSKGRRIHIDKDKSKKSFVTKKDPVFELKKLMEAFRAAPKENLRFFGGFVGYLGYDVVRFYEPIGEKLPDSLGTFDSYFILPKYLIIFDHIKKQLEILSFVSIGSTKKIKNIYLKEGANLKKIYELVIKPLTPEPLSAQPVKLKAKPNSSKDEFIKAVNKAKEHIARGDIIQTVISQRFEVDFKGDPFMAYRHLRSLNPSPYMFYLNFNGLKIAGASPEMLLRCEKEELITRPIAGTRGRGRNHREDLKLKESLLADPKEIAEHIMLVDLARNDLGRVAEKSSVNLPIFMSVEKFSHVMHIVSEARAKLAKSEDMFSSLISCFPAGTVSGAPKVRAMQIINQLEPDKRGIYAGSVGYFSFTNSLDTCIIIRTIIFKGRKAYVQAGAGIVADSKPKNEYRETINKARAQLLALELAQ